MLEGKISFVTGAARGRGIGRAIALKLAEKGADIAVADIRYEEAKSVADEIKKFGRKSIAVKMDVSIYDEVKKVFDQVKRELGDIDILVNNAAIMTNFATISNMQIEAWNKEIAVNLTGAFYCVKQVFDTMVAKNWGRIINISSVAGVLGGYGQCSYSASKAGLIGFTKTIALEGARFGITANAVTLGIIGTDAFYDLSEKVRTSIINRVPMRKEGSPEDVANMVAFLASEEAKYLNGASIMITGGLELFVI